MEVIMNAIADDLITLGLLIGCLGVLEILNILLGSMMALSDDAWDWKKFWQGILKAVLIAIIMAIYCLILELLPFILERASIEFPSDMVTFAQVLGIILVALKKYIKGIYEKLLTLLDIEESEITHEVG